MKHLLIIFSLLLTSVSWSKDVDFKDLFERDGLFYEKFTDTPFTGTSTGLQQGKIKKGLRNGMWLEFYESGQLSYKVNYKEGKKDGKAISYSEEGVIVGKYPFENGELNGRAYYYYDNGNLWVSSDWKNGVEDGEGKSYYGSGNLKSKATYKNRKTINRIEYYDDSSKQQKLIMKYNDKNQISEKLFYNLNGELEKTEIFKDGKLIETINH